MLLAMVLCYNHSLCKGISEKIQQISRDYTAPATETKAPWIHYTKGCSRIFRNCRSIGPPIQYFNVMLIEDEGRDIGDITKDTAISLLG